MLSRIDPEGPDRWDLIDFFTTNEFPFHVVEHRTSAEMADLIASGSFRDADRDSFWVVDDRLGRIGFLRLEDLQDDTPMFDLRLGTQFRGRGLGEQALHAATDLVFMTTEALRFEGHTRDDNIGMRRIFARAGWTKEAHHRQGWPVPDAASRDSIGYAILRSEWQAGTSTGLQWHDIPWFRPTECGGVTYESNLIPEPDEIIALYTAIGWAAYTDDSERLNRAVRSSTHVVTARRGGQLVGLVRVVSDGASIVYLQDVLVDPDHQRRGVGQELVTRVLAPYPDVRQTVLLTDAEPGQRKFYEPLGFSPASAEGRWDVRAFVDLT